MTDLLHRLRVMRQRNVCKYCMTIKRNMPKEMVKEDGYKHLDPSRCPLLALVVESSKHVVYTVIRDFCKLENIFHSAPTL